MAEEPAAIGPWPAPCPIPPGAPAALWFDGSLAAATAAAWLAGHRVEVRRLVPGAGFAPAAAMTEPGGWGAAQAAAQALGAAWLVLPWVRRADDPPGRISAWAAAGSALAAAGTGLWLPFVRLDPLAVGRLALACGVDPLATHDCPATPACGACARCRERRRVLVALGLGPTSSPSAGP